MSEDIKKLELVGDEVKSSPTPKIEDYPTWVKNLNNSKQVKLDLTPNGAPKGMWVLMNWPLGYSQNVGPGESQAEGEMLIKFVYIRYPRFTDQIVYDKEAQIPDLAKQAIRLVSGLRNHNGGIVPLSTWDMVKEDLQHGDALSLGEALFLLLAGGEMFREQAWAPDKSKI